MDKSNNDRTLLDLVDNLHEESLLLFARSQSLHQQIYSLSVEIMIQNPELLPQAKATSFSIKQLVKALEALKEEVSNG